MNFNIFKSKTFWGALGSAVVYVTSQSHIGVVEIVQAVMGLVTVVGLRDAVEKKGVV